MRPLMTLVVLPFFHVAYVPIIQASLNAGVTVIALGSHLNEWTAHFAGQAFFPLDVHLRSEQSVMLGLQELKKRFHHIDRLLYVMPAPLTDEQSQSQSTPSSLHGQTFMDACGDSFAQAFTLFREVARLMALQQQGRVLTLMVNRGEESEASDLFVQDVRHQQMQSLNLHLGEEFSVYNVTFNSLSVKLENVGEPFVFEQVHSFLYASYFSGVTAQYLDLG
ncbi:MAG: hypothetical protein ACK5T0_09525 [Vampirovibrionales bacterium]|jgi:hypothetical protein